MASNQIRLIESCEFGDAGDVLTPEPADVARLLVERGVAEWVEAAETREQSVVQAPREPRPVRRRGRNGQSV